MAQQPVVSVLAFRADQCEIVTSHHVERTVHKVHCDNGAVYPVDPHESLARIGSLLIKGSRSFVDRLQQPTHQETPDMDRSITPKTNPADRLDEACYALARHKCSISADRVHLTTYQIVLLLEALRDQAERDTDFAAALHQLAEKVETRYDHQPEAA